MGMRINTKCWSMSIIMSTTNIMGINTRPDKHINTRSHWLAPIHTDTVTSR